MTDALNSTVPAGWYPDPWGSTSQRWWDGTAWTEKLQSATDAPVAAEEQYTPVAVRTTYEPAVSSAMAAASTAPPLPSRRALRELAEAPASAQEEELVVRSADSIASPLPPLTHTPAFSPEPASVTPIPPVDDWAASLARWDDAEPRAALPEATPIFGDAPPVSYSHRAVHYKPVHGRTSAVWLLVFLPLLHAAAVVGSMYVFPGLLRVDAGLAMVVPNGDPAVFAASAGEWTLFAVAPLSLAFFAFTLVLGFQDRARLRLLGHDQTASPWWIVLSLFVYLIVRSVRVRQSTGRRGSGPLTTYICLYIAPPLAIFIAFTVASSLQGALPA